MNETGTKWEWGGNEVRAKQKRNGNETRAKQERNGDDVGTKRDGNETETQGERNGNDVGAKRERNGNETGTKRNRRHKRTALPVPCRVRFHRKSNKKDLAGVAALVGEEPHGRGEGPHMLQPNRTPWTLWCTRPRGIIKKGLWPMPPPL